MWEVPNRREEDEVEVGHLEASDALLTLDFRLYGTRAISG